MKTVFWFVMVVICAVNFGFAVDNILIGKLFQGIVNSVGFVAMLPVVFKTYEGM